MLPLEAYDGRQPLKRILPALVVFCCTLVLAKNPPEYPLTLKVVETKATATVIPSSTVKTDCTQVTDSNVDCTSRKSPDVTHTSRIQIAEGSDGNTYELECVPGRLTAFRQGFGEGAQASSGTLTRTESGCALLPGTYKARPVKQGLKLLIVEGDGKAHERTFRILSVRATAKPQP